MLRTVLVMLDYGFLDPPRSSCRARLQYALATFARPMLTVSPCRADSHTRCAAGLNSLATLCIDRLHLAKRSVGSSAIIAVCCQLCVRLANEAACLAGAGLGGQEWYVGASSDRAQQLNGAFGGFMRLTCDSPATHWTA